MADSNRYVCEFTPEYVAKHNKMPVENARKSSGEDRGTYVNRVHAVLGQGEYDIPVQPKDSGNEF
jgi:hypothetical protein